MPRTSKRSVEHFAVLSAAVLGGVLLWVFRFFVTPAPAGYGTHEQFGLAPCPMLEYLHVPCPGCGVTTSFAHAAHGELLTALQNQPMGLVVAAGLVAFLIWSLWLHARGRDAYRAVRALPLRGLLIGFAAALFTSWLYKLAIML